MFAGIASSLLSKYLGKYIEGLDAKNLKLSVTSGHAEIRSVALKKSALEDLQLPLEVREGYLGKIVLQIPWTNLGSEVSIIRLEELFVLVGPQEKQNVAEGIEKRAQSTKMSKLQLATMMGLDQPEASGTVVKKEEKKEEGLVSDFQRKIIDNLQIYIDKIHVRYEDTTTIPGQCFSIGFTLDKLHAQTTDEGWKPTILKIGQQILYKLVDLSHVSFYFNSNSDSAKPLQYKSRTEFISQMSKLIYNEQQKPDHHFVLKPASLQLKAQLDSENDKFVRPRARISLIVNTVGIAFYRQQMLNILAVVDRYSHFGRDMKYLPFYPTSGKRAVKDPGGWWKYAVGAVLSDVRTKNRKWKWEYISKRKVDRNDYITFYKLLQKEKLTKEADKKRLEELHNELPYEDILIYRKLANSSLLREQKKEEAEKKSKGFFQNLFSNVAVEENIENANEQIWKELYSSINYSENAQTPVAIYPPEFVKNEILAEIVEGSFDINESPDISSRGDVSIVCTKFSRMLGVVKLREGSTSINFNLGSFKAIDHYTKKQPLVIVDRTPGVNPLDNLISTSIDFNPLDLNQSKPLPISSGSSASATTSVDLRVNLTSYSMTLLLSPALVTKIIKTLEFPKKSKAAAELYDVASQGIQDLSKIASEQVMTVLQNGKKMVIDVNFKAPTVVVPANFTDENCPTFVADLGNIVVKHDSSLQTKTSELASETQKGNYLYDLYQIQISKIGAYIAPHSNAQNWHKLSDSEKKPYRILKEFVVSSSLRLLTVQNNTELPAYRISGELPDFKAFVSQDNIRDFFSILNSITSSFAQLTEIPENSGAPGESEELYIVKGALSDPGSVDAMKFRPKFILLEGNFKIQKVGVVLYFESKGPRNLENSPATSRISTNPRISLTWSNFASSLILSNQDVSASLSLKEFGIIDKLSHVKSSEKKYLIHTSENSQAFEVSYSGITDDLGIVQTSDRKADHLVVSKISDISIYVNRPTIARIILFAEQIQQTIDGVLKPTTTTLTNSTAPTNPTVTTISTAMTTSPAIISPIASPIISPINSPMTDKKDSTTITARRPLLLSLSVTLDGVHITLLKSGNSFLTGRVAGISTGVEVRQNSTIKVIGSLSSLSVTDAYNSPWSQLVKTSAGEKVVEFSYEDFPRNMHCDMAVKLKMASVSATFTSRITREIITYFTSFGKIQNTINYVASATSNTVKMYSATRLSLDVHISDPVIVIPRNYEVAAEYLLFHLGEISMKNDLSTVELGGAKEILDKMIINISKLHFNTVQKISSTGDTTRTSPLLQEMNVNIKLTRPITPNSQYLLSELQLECDIDKLCITLSESSLDSLSHTLIENISEEVKFQDSEYESVAKSFQIVDFNTINNTVTTNSELVSRNSEIPKKWKRMEILVSVKEASMIMSKGIGAEINREDTSRIFRFSMNNIKNSIQMYGDESMDLEFHLKELILSDIRNNSKSIFKQLIGPLHQNSGENQISFIANMTPTSMIFTVEATSPKFVFIGDFISEVYLTVFGHVPLFMLAIDSILKTIQPAPPPPSDLIVNFRLSKTEICAVTKPTETESNVAVVFLPHASLSLNSPVGKTSNLAVSAESLQIFRKGVSGISAVTLGTVQSEATLVQPLNISVKLDSTSNVTNIEIGVSNIRLTFNGTDAAFVLVFINSLTEVLNVLSGSSNGNNNSNKTQTQLTTTSSQEKSQATQKISLNIKEISVTLLDTVSPSATTSASIDMPVVTLEFLDLILGVDSNSDETKLVLELRTLFLADSRKSNEHNDEPHLKYIVHSPEAKKAIICVNYRLDNKFDPNSRNLEKPGAQHNLSVQMAAIEIFVNRPTLAALLLFAYKVNDGISAYSSAHSAASTRTAITSNNKDSQVVVAPSERTFPTLEFQMEFSVRDVTLTLCKNKKIFTQAIIESSSMKFRNFSDTSIGLDVFFGRITARDSENTACSTLIETTGAQKEKLAGEFHLETFIENSLNYKGYEMSVKFRLVSGAITLNGRALKELHDYLMDFSQIQELLTSARSAAVAATRDFAHQHKSTSLLLDIDIEHQYVIVPRNSKSSDEQVKIDLGRIMIKNELQEIQTQPSLLVDTITVTVSKTNVTTIRGNWNSSMIRDIDVTVAIKRVLRGDEDHKIPFEVKISIPKLIFNIRAKALPLITGILSENLSEKPAESDAKELSLISEYMNFDISNWKYQKMKEEEMKQIEEKRKGKEIKSPWITTQISVEIEEISLALYREYPSQISSAVPTAMLFTTSTSSPRLRTPTKSIRTTSPTAPTEFTDDELILVHYTMKELSLNYRKLINEDQILDFSLATIILSDDRKESEYAYKRIITSLSEKSEVDPGTLTRRVSVVTYTKPTTTAAIPATQQIRANLVIKDNQTHVAVQISSIRFVFLPTAITEAYFFIMSHVNSILDAVGSVFSSQGDDGFNRTYNEQIEASYLNDNNNKNNNNNNKDDNKNKPKQSGTICILTQFSSVEFILLDAGNSNVSLMLSKLSSAEVDITVNGDKNSDISNNTNNNNNIVINFSSPTKTPSKKALQKTPTTTTTTTAVTTTATTTTTTENNDTDVNVTGIVKGFGVHKCVVETVESHVLGKFKEFTDVVEPVDMNLTVDVKKNVIVDVNVPSINTILSYRDVLFGMTSLKSILSFTNSILGSINENETSSTNSSTITTSSTTPTTNTVAKAGKTKQITLPSCPLAAKCPLIADIKHRSSFTHPCPDGRYCQQKNNDLHMVHFIHPTALQIREVHWQKMVDNAFVNYNSNDNSIIENAYQMNRAGTCTLSNGKYIINFAKMLQENTKTKYTRNLRRKLIYVGPISQKGEREDVKVSMKIQGVNFSLLDDKESREFPIPLLRMELGQIETGIILYDQQVMPRTYVSAFARVTLGAYNLKLSTFEPVIETCPIKLVLSQTEVNTDIDLSSEGTLNVNVSTDAIEVSLNAMKLSQEIAAEFSGSNKTKETPTETKLLQTMPTEKAKVSFSPYILLNNTGTNLTVNVSVQQSFGSQILTQVAAASPRKASSVLSLAKAASQKASIKLVETLEIPDGSESPLDLRKDRHNLNADVSRYLVTISLSVENPTSKVSQKISNQQISFNSIGVYSYSASQKGVSHLVSEITTSGGSKLIKMRSNHTIKNETETELDLTIDATGAWLQYKLPPNSEFSIPLGIEFRNLRIRPANGTYEWSEFVQNEKQSDEKKNKLTMFETSSGVYFCAKKNSSEQWGVLKILTQGFVKNSRILVDNTLTLRPLWVIENHLPENLKISFGSKNSRASTSGVFSSKHGQTSNNDSGVYSMTQVLPGKELPVHVTKSRDLNDVEISIGLNFYRMSNSLALTSSDLKFKMVDQDGLPLSVLGSRVDGTTSPKIVLFVNYWIYNCTGLPLRLTYNSAPLSRQMTNTSTNPLTGDPRSWYNFPLEISEDTSVGRDGKPRVGEPQLVLFSAEEAKVKAQIRNSEFSSSIPLGALKREGKVTINDPGTKREFNLGISISPGSLKTTLVHFYPGTILVNLSRHPMCYRQRNCTEFTIRPNEQIPFHWTNFEMEKLLEIKINGPSTNPSEDTMQSSNWSVGFKIGDIDNFQLKLVDSRNHQKSLGIHVNIQLYASTNFVILGGNEKPFYRIDNQSGESIIISQKNCTSKMVIQKGISQPFYWDDPQAQGKVAIVSVEPNKEQQEIVLDQIQGASVRLPNSNIGLEVIADGPTRVLIVTDKEQSESLSEENLDADKQINLKFTASVDGIGISLISPSIQRRKEFLYLFMKSIHFSFEQSSVDQSIEFSVKTLQLDDQVHHAPYPVILYDDTKSPEKPFVQLTLVKDTRFSTINFIKYFAILIQELDICVDKVFVGQLYLFITKVTEMVTGISYRSIERQLNSKEGMILLRPSDMTQSQFFYFELFHINPVKASLSYRGFIPTAAMDPEMELHVSELFKYLHSAVGDLLEIDELPVRLNALVLLNPFASQNQFIDILSKHYMQSILLHWYLIIGSADFIGSPVKFVDNLGTGVYDFFYEPSKGLVESPAQFGLGIVKGTGSLIGKTISATFGTASRVVNSIATLGTLATFDSDYQKDRQQQKLKQPKHIGEGLAMGVMDFGMGLAKGISGIVTEPIKGVQKEKNFLGFAKGVGKGLAGVVTKPVVGTLDLVSRTTQGIMNTPKTIENEIKGKDSKKYRIRPPRHFGGDRILYNFNQYKAFGFNIMMMTDSGRLGNQFYAHHFATINDREVLLMTESRVLLISLELISKTKWTVDWTIPFNAILTTKFSSNAVVFQTDKETRTAKLPEEEFLKLEQWWADQSFSKKPLLGRLDSLDTPLSQKN